MLSVLLPPSGSSCARTEGEPGVSVRLAVTMLGGAAAVYLIPSIDDVSVRYL